METDSRINIEGSARAEAALRDQADAWWLRLRSGSVTGEEAAAFAEWRGRSPEHLRAWHEVIRVWQSLEPVGAKAVQRDPRIMHRPGGVPSYLAQPGRRAFLGTAVTASVTALAVFPPLRMWPSVLEFADDYHTGTGEQRQIALGDRMTVQMNTQTRINRRALETTGTADGDSTAIELVAGEAEIDTTVAVQPLTVYAGDARVLARAARFNVRYTGPQVCVTCFAGTVEIDHPTRRQTVETGQQVLYDARGVHPILVADPAATAWRTGSLVFVDTPLADVIAEINRYRPGQVILRGDELARLQVRMRVALDQLDDALTMIGSLYGAKVTRMLGGVVVLSLNA